MRVAILEVRSMRFFVCTVLPVACILCLSGRLCAPAALLYRRHLCHRTWEVALCSFFDEYDALQLQYPNQNQNTANYKLNYGLPHNLEIDVDSPYPSIYRTGGNPASTGVGDTNLGIKMKFRKESPDWRAPALAASFYIELPTGRREPAARLGAGRLLAEPDRTKVAVAKNQTHRKLSDICLPATPVPARWEPKPHAGTSSQAGFHCCTTLPPHLRSEPKSSPPTTESGSLGKSQFQTMVGGQYAVRKGLSFCFGILGGRYVASPRLGGQIGFAVDFPDVFESSAH